MLKYCRKHNRLEDYQCFFDKWTDEEIANIALTLCHMVDKMMTTYQKQLEEEFVTEGGIKERMTAARLDQRETQRQIIERQAKAIETLQEEIIRLKARLRAEGIED